jgi:RNA 3'-terminal phosphate cyclase (ATP)
LRLSGISGVGNLPLSIAERQRESLVERILPFLTASACPVDIQLMNVPTPGQGTFLVLNSETTQSFSSFTSLGARGKRAEVVGREVAEEFLTYYFSGSALDPHLSDQIVLYLAMCREESAFSASCITEHLLTNLWVIGLFHEYSYVVEGETGKPGIVRITPPVSDETSLKNAT